ncbi:hypothetical protein CSE16_11145 [Solibacillus sp. R5-41]|uniref:DUF2922 domain-containing protein n=1 Tax=Solibacillus sp. R5-41 TaxID=2048654 RepID=UPI000C127AAF|nr:DUF2922 domain-containing protein [Solibacillus sp. R5-41]ATP40560.1 hypothetical protein CSE16_11145 [Solibacillus sp. R5-41]
MTQVLQLTFANALDKTMTLNIAQPKANLSETEINAAMQIIVDQGIFAKDGSVFNMKKSARVVERHVTSFELNV